jgi:hypothetical protein
MKREVIQELLNLHGVEAIALVTRKMRPVFHGLSHRLDERQKLTLGQGVLQMLENTAVGFDLFEFYFLNHTVFIYKQTSGLVLLVVTNPELDLKEFQIQIDKFRQILAQDIYSGVTLFKQISGSTTQPDQINFDGVELSSRQLVSAAPVNLPKDSPQSHIEKPREKPRVETKEKPGEKLAEMLPSKSQVLSPVAQTPADSVPLQTWLDDLNKISACGGQYLGKTIAGNYWKSTRSPGWLEEFQIDSNVHLSHPKPEMLCDREQTKDLQKWAVSYVQQCKRVIRNFDVILQQKTIDFSRTDFLITLLKGVNEGQKTNS